MPEQILRVTRDSIFKRRPVPPDTLPDSDKQVVLAERSFSLHHCAYDDANGTFASHIKIALKAPEDFIRGINTWFVYDRHAQVEHDGDIAYPKPTTTVSPLPIVTRNTTFKRRPIQASQLSPTETHPATAGSRFPLHTYSIVAGENYSGEHVRFAFRDRADDVRGINTWYAFGGHVRIERDGRAIYPPARAPQSAPPSQPAAPTSARGVRLPGNSSTFYPETPIFPGSNFTWGEATRNGERIPENTTVVNNIIALARELQRARDAIGKPFHITSWYRPEPYNSRAGGARNSQHLTGKAVDLWVTGFTGRQIANRLFASWPGGTGIYAHLPEIVHLDIGAKRSWGF